jgi:hypothetical protein
MMYYSHNAPASDLSSAVTIDWLLDWVAVCANDFREEFRASGAPDLVETCELKRLEIA